jgi:hypothetical protein
VNATRRIALAGFHHSLWIICDNEYESHVYNDIEADRRRFYSDCAQQIEAFFHDEACGIDEGDELYSIIRSGEVDWQALGELYGESTWINETEQLQTR